MKIIIMISLLLTLLAMILPIILAPVIIPDPPISKELSQKEPQNTGSSLYYDPNTETSAFDDSFSITLLCGGSTTEISLTDYLIGAVSAEMPASFSLEALKAQSVALRTYLLHKITVSPSSAHPEADIYIMGLTPLTEEKDAAGYPFTMERVRSYNEALRSLAGEREHYYLDLVEALADESGFLPASDSTDGIHLTQEKYPKWAEYLRTHYADGETE